MPDMTGVATHYPYCALQCGMSVGPAGEISPRRFPLNRGGQYRKGWTAGELLGHPGQRTTPLLHVRFGTSSAAAADPQTFVQLHQDTAAAAGQEGAA